MTLVHKRLRPMTYSLAVAGFCFMGVMAACQSKQEQAESQRGDLREEREDVAEEQRDVTEEQRDVQEATQELNEMQRAARAEWQQDYLSFKREMIGEINENEQLILQKREEAAGADAQQQGQFTTPLTQAEQRNRELRDRLNNATDQGDEAWTKFKDDFRKSVNEVEESINNIDVK
jgi:hypothetical protein